MLAAAFLAASSMFMAYQAAPQTLEGSWEGTLQSGGRGLRIGVTFSRAADGRYSAEMDIPDQGALGIRVAPVSLAAGVVKFALTAANATYEGKLNESSTEIRGTWSQGGSQTLTLKRAQRAVRLRRPQEPKPPYPYRSEEVTFANSQARIALAGTLTLPPGAGPFPAVVLITGSGPQNRDEELLGHKPFLVLADHLTRHGIAVLRYDDRGFGQSQGVFATATSIEFAEDAEAAWRYLRARAEIDPRRTGLLGHSEGGLIGPMVAARNPEIAFLVLLAGPGVSGEQILHSQAAMMMRAEGASEESIKAKNQEQAALINIVREEPSATRAVERIRAALASQPEATIDAANRQMNSPWMRFFLFYDPAPALTKVKAPVLALNGGLDLQVPADPNLAGIEAALRRGGNREVTILRLPKVNHLFQTCETGAFSEYAKIEETM